MKVCPSCNARVANDAATCHSCDHAFAGASRAPGREAKKTMMGLPALNQQEPGSSPGEDQGNKQKQTLFGIPALNAETGAEEDQKTAMVSADALPVMDIDLGDGEADDSTRQVDPSALANALGGSQNKRQDAKKTMMGLRGVGAGGLEEESSEDDADAAASAWGLAESSASDEKDGATQVMSPDMLDAAEDLLGGAAMMDRNQTGKHDDDGPPSTRPEFGTLMGMSLEESSGEEQSSAGAMHQGDRPGDAFDGASTQALSPDELAKLGEFDFRGEVEQSAGADQGSTRIQAASELSDLPMPDFGTSEEEDDLKTAVLDGGAAESFQLPKPGGQSAPEAAPSPEEQRSFARNRRDSGGQRSAPRSGVFRSAKKRRTDPELGQSPQTDSLSDTGVSGTGTYRMSNTDTGTSEAPFAKADRDLSIGGVGSGGARTSFPTGASSTGAKKVKEGAAAGSTDVSKGRTGPRFQIGESKPKPEPSAQSTSPTPAGAAPLPAEQPRPSEPASDMGTGPSPLEGFSLSGVLPSKEAGVEELEPQAIEPQEIEPEEIAPLDVEPLDVEFEPVSSPQSPAQPQPSPTPQGSGPSFGAEPAQPQPSPTPQGSGPSFGAEPAQPQASPAPQGSGPSFGAEPAPQAMQSQAPQQVQGQPQPSAQADDTTERMVGLLQRGFGALAGLLLLGIALVSALAAGLPDEPGAMALVAGPALLGLMVFGLVAAPVKQQIRSAGMAVIAVVALLSFAVAMSAEMGTLLAIGQFAGGMLLICAAIFPLFGKFLKNA